MLTKDQLIKDFKNIGIKEGDVLFIRISYKSIGKVEGGPKCVIDSLLECLGDTGTLVATAFPKRELSVGHIFRRKIIYKQGAEPTTGIIPKLMCTYNNAYLSSNPITPFVLIGNNAQKITSVHTANSLPYSLLENIALNYNAKCLRIGGKVFDGTTHISVRESLVKNNEKQIRKGEGLYYYDNEGNLIWKEKNVSYFCSNWFEKFYFKYLKDKAVLNVGKIGNGESVVTDMHITYNIEHEMLINNPKEMLCDDPNCLTCRCSYSFSDMSIIRYIFNQIKLRFICNDKNATSRIKDAIILGLFGRKCQ